VIVVTESSLKEELQKALKRAGGIPEFVEFIFPWIQTERAMASARGDAKAVERLSGLMGRLIMMKRDALIERVLNNNPVDDEDE
jgi:hypothetical protein